jgi:hypothetical protein
MGFLDKAKAAVEQTAAKAKEGVDDVQSKRELSSAYSELGKTTFELIEAGEISHPSLEPIALRIRTQKEKDAGEPVAVAETTTYDADQPPAMPT